MLDCQTLSIVPVPPKGEVPIPRVGHATALFGNVLVSWGGDTKTRVEDEQDQGLYLLNLGESDLSYWAGCWPVVIVCRVGGA